jgi:hypothetical protein
MKHFIGLALILAMAGCATCKSSDTVEQCRTKQRDKSQKYSSLMIVSPPDSRLAAAGAWSTRNKVL